LVHPLYGGIPLFYVVKFPNPLYMRVLLLNDKVILKHYSIVYKINVQDCYNIDKIEK
jgi:hypothetical protein